MCNKLAVGRVTWPLGATLTISVEYGEGGLEGARNDWPRIAGS